MKKILFVTAAVFLGLSASAQNAGDAFDEFKRQRENQFSEYAEQRAREFEEFKARYYSAFEQFKQSYRKSLEDDVKVVDLMSSDDGIPIEPVKLAPAPPVAASTAAEQKQILRSNIRSIATMKPDDLLPELSSPLSHHTPPQLPAGYPSMRRPPTPLLPEAGRHGRTAAHCVPGKDEIHG